MKLGTGTVEPIESDIPVIGKRSRTALGGRSSGTPGGGGGGQGGGGGTPRKAESEPEDSNIRNKSKILTGFLLLVVLMTFGGLIGAYVVVATNRALEWQPFDLPFQVWISTLVIALSSLTYEVGRRAIERNKDRDSKRWLIVTTILGGIFIASQMILWLALVGRGFYMRGNPYAGFFYILTAAHAVHVFGGVVALGGTLLRSWYPTQDPKEISYRTDLSTSVGWYWHFMGGLWVVLFILLAFWK